MNGRKAKLYKSGRLQFMGDHYVAITMLLRFSDNHPDVREKFRQQIEMREKPQFTSPEYTAKK
jgi:hypothetical protein